MAAGDRHVDYPGDGTGLSVIPLGSGHALTSRVRRVGEKYLFITAPRNGVGHVVVLSAGDLLELAWQPESTKDLIRSHVFTALRNARARGLF